MHGRPSTTPLAVNHTGLFPSVTVSFNLARDVSLSQAAERIERMQREMGMPDDAAQLLFRDAAQAYQESLGDGAARSS